MATTYDWRDFRIFDDNCILDAGSLGTTDLERTLPNFEVGKQLDHACLKFDTWLGNLRKLQQEPNHCGIPKARISNVVALLDRFFPLGEAFVNVAYQKHSNNPTYYPDPITVNFGNATIDINDGPSALGYIFSIANQPAPKPGQPVLPARTFSTYGLPLLVIFTRWVYLAYIRERKKDTTVQGEPQQVVNMVPFMSSIMYTMDNNGGFQFLLGSTYVTNGADPSLSVDSYQKRRIMNVWRWQEVLDTNQGLSYYKPSRVNNLPSLPPTLLESVCEAYLKLLRGNNTVAVKGQTLYEPPNPNNPQGPLKVANINDQKFRNNCNEVFKGVRETLQAIWKAKKKPFKIIAMPQGSAIDAKATKKNITNALTAIIQFRFDPTGYKHQDPQIQGLFENLIRAYFMPHMFNSLDTSFTQGEVIDELLVQALVQPVQKFWIDHSTHMLLLLDQLYYWVTNVDDALNDGGPRIPRFGRCAETHPIVAIMPSLTPTRILPAPNNPDNQPVTPVRGFAFSIRQLHQDSGNLLAENFTSSTLNSIHSQEDGLYRKPCPNCEVLLPQLDVPVGPTNYDRHLYILYPNAGVDVE